MDKLTIRLLRLRWRAWVLQGEIDRSREAMAFHSERVFSAVKLLRGVRGELAKNEPAARALRVVSARKGF